MIKNLFIALAFALMLINPSISIAAEFPVDVQEMMAEVLRDYADRLDA